MLIMEAEAMRKINEAHIMKQISNIFLFIICFLAVSCLSFAETQTDVFFNKSQGSVILTVPYYEHNGNSATNLDIILQPGDMYQPSDHGNGFVYKKYGFMPDMVSNSILVLSDRIPRFHNNSNEKIDEEFLQVKKAIASTNVPDWWIEKKVEDFKIKEDAYRSNLDYLKKMHNQYEERKLEFPKPDQRKTLDEEYAKTFKDIERKIHNLSEVTNITAKSLKQLNKVKADIDKDGLSNFEEFYCDSNPLLKNGVAVYPHLLEIKTNGYDVVTNFFMVANLTKTNSVYCLDYPNKDVGQKYAPIIKAMDLQTSTNGQGQIILNLGPKQKVKFYLLIKKDLLAYRMLNYYTIKIRSTNVFDSDLYKALLKLYVSGTHHTELIPPVIKSPKVGEYFRTLKNVKFAWVSTNENAVVYSSSVPAYNVFIYDNNGHEAGFALGGLGWMKGDHTLIKQDRCDNIKPGNYIWRVVKQDAYNSPVCSDWGWFAVGKEISPSDTLDKPRRVPPVDERLTRKGLNFIVGQREDKWLSNENEDANSKPYFLYPLPEGLQLGVLEDGRSGWFLYGAAESPGCFTNYYVKFSGDAWVTNRQVITVLNSLDKIKTNSIYRVNYQTVSHEVTVNIPFKYSASEFYNAFEGKNGPMLNADAQADFAEDLPEGLAGQKSDDDYIISGTPKKAGIYTNYFVVSDGVRSAKERHVFKIQDIGEPSPVKKPENKHEISFLANHKPGLVEHRMKVGEKYKYPMGMDWISADPAMKKNMKNEEQVDADFLRPLPDGFIMSIESEEIKDKTYDYFMLCANPRAEGTFTNFARIVNTEFVYTNMHIFKIEKGKKY